MPLWLLRWCRILGVTHRRMAQRGHRGSGSKATAERAQSKRSMDSETTPQVQPPLRARGSTSLDMHHVRDLIVEMRPCSASPASRRKRPRVAMTAENSAQLPTEDLNSLTRSLAVAAVRTGATRETAPAYCPMQDTSVPVLEAFVALVAKAVRGLPVLAYCSRLVLLCFHLASPFACLFAP